MKIDIILDFSSMSNLQSTSSGMCINEPVTPTSKIKHFNPETPSPPRKCSKRECTFGFFHDVTETYQSNSKTTYYFRFIFQIAADEFVKGVCFDKSLREKIVKLANNKTLVSVNSAPVEDSISNDLVLKLARTTEIDIISEPDQFFQPKEPNVSVNGYKTQSLQDILKSPIENENIQVELYVDEIMPPFTHNENKVSVYLCSDNSSQQIVAKHWNASEPLEVGKCYLIRAKSKLYKGNRELQVSWLKLYAAILILTIFQVSQ